jgi:superfamily II DNA helicase RecQ
LICPKTVEVAKSRFFDNKTLQEIAYFLPDNEAKFLQINGVGAVKYKKYGEQFLALLICPKTVEVAKSRFFIISSTDDPC